MNEIGFRKFTPVEFDLFFSLCAKMKRLGTESVVFTFEELKELVNYSSRDRNRFILDLTTTYAKMLSLNLRYENESELVQLVLLQSFK